MGREIWNVKGRRWTMKSLAAIAVCLVLAGCATIDKSTDPMLDPVTEEVPDVIRVN